MLKSTGWKMLALAACLIAILAGCGKEQRHSGNAAKGAISIGSKDFTESIVLAHIMADLIEEHTDLKVNRKVNLGGSSLALKALLNNDIQIYPEYTGTIAYNYNQHDSEKGEATLHQVRKLARNSGLEFFEPFGFNNNYTLAVTRETAEKYNLKTLSDLVKWAPELTLASDFEFIDRSDGYYRLKDQYGVRFKAAKGMNRGIMYRSLLEKGVDVVVAYNTDGQLVLNQLVDLKDDKQGFINYEAGPLVRQDTLALYPEIAAVLEKIKGQISESEMREINVKIDHEGLKAKVAVREFLKQKGLVK